MSHEIAKLLLEHAGTFLERREAIKTALSLGMPLNEIEAYLDWVDMLPDRPARNGSAKKANGQGSDAAKDSEKAKE